MITTKRSICLLVVLIGSALTNECGLRASLPKSPINYGIRSKAGMWPWHGALYHQMNQAEPTYKCGVTIISKLFTITAASCTYPTTKIRKLRPSELFIRVGITNIKIYEQSLQNLTVVEVIRHRNYSSDATENDIALLRVAPSIEYTDYVRPICFWNGELSEKLVVGKNGLAPGWGLNKKGLLSANLRHVAMPIVARNSCIQTDTTFFAQALKNSKTFCAGSRNGTSLNLGNVGGGLYIQDGEKWFIRGIVSFGKMDPITLMMDTRSYVVITDVAQYLPWVFSHGTMDVKPTPAAKLQEFSCGQKTENNIRSKPWEGKVHRNGSTRVRLGDVAIITTKYVVSPGAVFRKSDFLNPFKLIVVFKVDRHVLLEVGVKAIIAHEQFNRFTRENNIALLLLRSPLTFNETLQPVCLWMGNSSFELNLYLGSLTAPPISRTDCMKHTESEEIYEQSLCFKLTSNQTATRGDIIYQESNGTWFVRGITYGICRSRQSSDFYVYILDVGYYSDWVWKIIADQEEMVLPLSSCKPQDLRHWNFHVFNDYSALCYGTLVSPILVLTTAACMESQELEDLEIHHAADRTVFKVSAIHLHPEYDKFLLTNNIALVQLKSPLDNEPVCLPSMQLNPEKLELFDSIWQLVPYRHLNASFKLTDTFECSKKWSREQDNTEIYTDGRHLCGHSDSTGSNYQAPCTDMIQGAPLSYEIGGKRFLRGFLESYACELEGSTKVFVDVTHYAEWIHQVFEQTSYNFAEGRKAD